MSPDRLLGLSPVFTWRPRPASRPPRPSLELRCLGAEETGRPACQDERRVGRNTCDNTLRSDSTPCVLFSMLSNWAWNEMKDFRCVVFLPFLFFSRTRTEVKPLASLRWNTPLFQFRTRFRLPWPCAPLQPALALCTAPACPATPGYGKYGGRTRTDKVILLELLRESAHY